MLKLLSKLTEKLRGSEPRPEPILISQPLKPIVSQEQIAVLRALRQINRLEPQRSYSLKLYPGQFNESLDRVTCQRCLSRRCQDYEPTLIAVHHSKEGLQLYGCQSCNEFLIRIMQ